MVASSSVPWLSLPRPSNAGHEMGANPFTFGHLSEVHLNSGRMRTVREYQLRVGIESHGQQGCLFTRGQGAQATIAPWVLSTLCEPIRVELASISWVWERFDLTCVTIIELDGPDNSS